MVLKDLRDFVSQVEAIGQIRYLENADWNLEIGAVTEVAAGIPECPMLMFDRTKGCEKGYRVLTNVLHTPVRMAIALGIDHNLPPIDMLRRYKERIKNMKLIPPVEVAKPSVKENVLEGDQIDVYKFPAPKWHEHDGGRYIGTGCIIILRDPDEGWVNLGVYRIQVHNKHTLGIMISPGKHGSILLQKYWSRNQPCPVALVLGQEPALLIGANTHLPWRTPEYEYAGFIRDSPVEIFKSDLSGLPIPANAEIVIEGDIPPRDENSIREGPFGEAMGYYSVSPSPQPIIRINRILHRDNPIVWGAPPLKPQQGMTHYGLPIDAAEVWDVIDKSGIVDVRGVWMHQDYITVVSIKQRFAGHAKHAALAAMATTAGHGYLRRIVVVVDDDIDPTNISDVLWAICTRCDLSTVEIVKECLSSAIDPMVTEEQRKVGNVTSNRIIINACKAYSRLTTFPETNAISPQLRAQTIEKWVSALKQRHDDHRQA